MAKSERTDQPAQWERGKRVRRLAAVVSKLTAPWLRDSGVQQANLIARLSAHWPDIVGRDLAAASAPERLAFPHGAKSGGILHLRVQGALAPVVQHQEPQVIERINTFFGYGAVARLRLIHAPVAAPGAKAPAPRPLTEDEERHLGAALGGVADKDLKAALSRLGRAVLGAPPKG
ncbi:MAG: DciA family protein [Alphaproteobacteria bacterium]